MRSKTASPDIFIKFFYRRIYYCKKNPGSSAY